LEEDLLKLIEKTKEEIREKRMAVLKLSFPAVWRKFLIGAAEGIPREKYEQLVGQSKLDMAEARNEVIKTWNESLENLFSLIRKRFKEPIETKEIEKQVLALIDLLKEAAHFIIEELKAIDIIEAELK